MPRGGCSLPRSAFAAVAFAVMVFAALAAACLVRAVFMVVAARGLLVKNLLLFGAELAVELFDGLVAGGYAVLAFGLHGLHAVEALGCGQALECIPASALFRLAGGRLHGADKLVPRAFLRAGDLQTLLEVGHEFGVAIGAAVCFARVGALFASLGRGFARCGHGVWAVAAAATAAIRATASQDLLRWSMVRFLSSEGFMKKMKCRRLRSHEKARRGPGWFCLVLLLL